MTCRNQEIVVLGTPISHGISIGQLYFLRQTEDAKAEIIPPFFLSQREIDVEVWRYQCAIVSACQEIKELQKQLHEERVFDAVSMLDVHLQMMQDPLLTSCVEVGVRNSRRNVDYVFQGVIQTYQDKFNCIADPFFRERFKDIRDVSQRIISHLRRRDEKDKEANKEIDKGIASESGSHHGSHRRSLINIPSNSIVFASDLTALDIAEADGKRVLAIVTKDGAVNSHAAIIAKAKEIPYVSNIDVEKFNLSNGVFVIVDGRTGEVIINPLQETIEKYQQVKYRLGVHLEKIKGVGKLQAETYDGYKVKLSANIEMIGEQHALHEFGASGVGLLRTESAFLGNEDFPSEDEQFAIYHQFVMNMKGLPIVFRVFDLGGDKCFKNSQMSSILPSESVNSFLGCRSIRFLLRERELFKKQLRAIVRTSAYGDVSIMFPMVSSLSELLEAKALLKEVQAELIALSDPIADYIPVGCMIEVPSAALIVDLLARECDFLSIGTNDLVQYTLAVNRCNNELNDLYSPVHPSMIRLIKLIVNEANQQGIPVSVCGEMASDERFIPLLLGLGVHELSVAPCHLIMVKHAIRSTSIVTACKLAEEVLTLKSAQEIADFITYAEHPCTKTTW